MADEDEGKRPVLVYVSVEVSALSLYICAFRYRQDQAVFLKDSCTILTGFSFFGLI
ncbi:MAG: hypothetical protein IJF49_09370 [Clostridia bacterium]|nr:hypothetical protein [Clostridia bacterium]